MERQYLNYYLQQGRGLSTWHGQRFQRGAGFFGRLLSGVVPFFKNLLPKVGKRALKSAVDLGQDILAGENVKESAMKRLKEGATNVGDEVLTSIKEKFQSGTGRKRKRRSKSRSKRKSYKKKRSNYVPVCVSKRTKRIKRRRKRKSYINNKFKKFLES